MIFFFVILFHSKGNELCSLKIDQQNIRTSGLNLFYQINDSELIEMEYNGPYDKLKEVLEYLPFVIRFYLQYSYCQDYVLFYEKNISSINECMQIELTFNDIPDMCFNGVSIRIYDEIDLDYNLTIKTRKNESVILKYYSDNKDYYDLYIEPFTIEVYISSTYYFNGTLHLLEIIEVNEEFTNRTYNVSHIPDHLLPYNVCFSKDLPYFYKIGYKVPYEENVNEIYIIYDQLTLYNHEPFDLPIYLFTGPSCNYENGEEIFKIKAERSSKCTIITVDDIPDNCTIENYPDDDQIYKPIYNNSSSNSSVPYAFLFYGECSKFDTLIERCNRDPERYPLCPFVNNAIQNLCTNTYDSHIFEKIDIKSDKVFIVNYEDMYLFYYVYFKHKMIVHIKAVDTNDPEIYFKNPSQPTINEHSLIISGNAKTKIQYLYAENYKFSSSYSLFLDTLYLKNSTVSYYSSDTFTHADYIYVEDSEYSIPGNYLIKQFTVVINNNKTSRPMYQIKVDQSSVKYYSKDWYDENYELIFDAPSAYQVETFGLIAASHYIDYNINQLYRQDNGFPALNISLIPPIENELTSLENHVLLSESSKYYVNLTTSGNWKGVYAQGNIYFTAYHDYIDLETHLHKRVNLTKEPIYAYEPTTWVPQLYQPLDFTNDTSLITYLVVTDTDGLYSCNQRISELLYCRWRECYEKGHLVDYIIDAKCCTSENINDALKNVTYNTDKVIIENNIDSVYIDLNKLPQQTTVEITSNKNYFDDDSSKKLKDGYLIFGTIELYGAINEKVSYLTISHSTLKVTGLPLDVYSCKLIYSDLYYDSVIDTHDLIVDFESHVNLLGSSRKFFTKQYCLIVPSDDYEEENGLTYRVSFSTDRWSLYTKTINDEEYEPINEYYGYVPYEYADTVGLILLSHNFDFYIEDENVNQLKNVNITLLNYQFDPDQIIYCPINDSKYGVTFEISGNNWNYDKKVNITFTAFQNLVDLNINSTNLIIEKEEVFNYTTHQLVIPTQSPHPYPTKSPVPTKIPAITPIPDIIDVLYDGELKKEIENIDLFNSDLDKMYNKLNNSDIEGNSVVVINALSFPFKKDLNENQFIKPISNSKINYIEGNLNLVFPDKGEVTVSLNKNENVKLSLKGNGTISFNSEEEKINIENNALINGSTLIKISGSAKSILMNSVDLLGDGSIDCEFKDGEKAPLIIQKVNVNGQANSKLTSVIVNDTLTISQESQLEINDVSLENSTVVYNLFNNYKLDTVLTGNFDKPPERIEINSAQCTEYQTTVDFASGYFKDNSCNEWAKKIKTNCYLIGHDCDDYYSKILDARGQTLSVWIQKDAPTNGDKDTDGKGGIGTGGIIGIVVAVIVVIAIVVVVVIVIKKKKKNNNSSTGSIQEGDEEKQVEV